MEEIERERKPKITVITPTYNRANLIAETIESILNQDYRDFEYLILDDGSTDNTEEIVKPYLKDERVKYLKHENSGEAETVNWGWNLAKGEYFTQVNSDDPILPKLFSEMVRALDENKNAVVAYPDFYITDEKGNITKRDRTPDWNFINALSSFSCYAASAGTFIRKKAFSDWKKIKNSKFKYINDVEMYWKMALRGDFLHVPKFLATWRIHGNSISSDRYKSIPEVLIWFNEYFSQDNLPKEVLDCKIKLRDSVENYCFSLLKMSEAKNKNELIVEFFDNFFKSDNLQISDSDLIGNKFNGHDLHFYLNESGVNSKQLVWIGESKDENTFKIARNRPNREEIYKNASLLQKHYSLNGILNPLGYDILCDPLFLNTNVVHLHLMHNNIFDIQLLPLMTRLKPIVWTVHDPWILGGHCIHHFDCNKWETQCGDCPYLDKHFIISKDNSALNFALKKDAIQNSKFDIIVASRWMEEKLKKSPILKGKNIHFIPFGINQNIFKLIDKNEARKKLEIPRGALVISFRCDYSGFKGMEFIEYVLKKIKSNKNIVLLVLANNLGKKYENFEIKKYGWVKDDKLLAQIYSASDLFLMPSVVESFGMMAIEVMSCGTLPIVLDGTALPDTVNAPECGVSVKRDKEEYLKTVQYFIDNENERIKRAKKCLEFAKNNYNKDVYVEKITKVYDKVLEEYHISEEDQYLLNQLKKNVSTDNCLNSESSKHFKRQSFIKNKIDLSKHYAQLLFIKYKNIIPKKIRIFVKNIINKVF